jgi:hypothetical protein
LQFIIPVPRCEVKKMDLALHLDVIVLPASRMQVIDAPLEFILLLLFRKAFSRSSRYITLSVLFC